MICKRLDGLHDVGMLHDYPCKNSAQAEFHLKVEHKFAKDLRVRRPSSGENGAAGHGFALRAPVPGTSFVGLIWKGTDAEYITCQHAK